MQLAWAWRLGARRCFVACSYAYAGASSLGSDHAPPIERQADTAVCVGPCWSVATLPHSSAALLLLLHRRRGRRSRDELDGSAGLARTEHGHDVGQRHRLEFTRQEIANLEHAELLAQQDAQLGVHVLRQRRPAGATTATSAAARTLLSGSCRGACSAASSPRPLRGVSCGRARGATAAL